ncbi:hypothetical protein CEXT_85711 [Caerostris extrusa]|uniref:Uncharacterized protein n=1 Tax=Caerostris extrusa TaxID=172846 RepID=A0AAV4W9S5_CAEEX|nr:hypothetical protein CEXT_85711 [Caerostris extrusa]
MKSVTNLLSPAFFRTIHVNNLSKHYSRGKKECFRPLRGDICSKRSITLAAERVLLSASRRHMAEVERFRNMNNQSIYFWAFFETHLGSQVPLREEVLKW